ncbi:uncharacterized protein LOC121304951 isoform X2 [Polyodon spathula]|uniref:uncharacterized protein LOC121304951 isoform X2 n=1 Tax=Polyodon spathula TaxID=7913 RepID=UPI001B7E7FDE|nr:uncharacterized protein LOC121304951 isoform X2 [Polyodon spathula]
MGCALSGPGVNPGSRTAPEANESGSDTVTGTGYRLKSAPLPLSEAQKDLIRESWKILHEDIARVGIIMFIRVMSFIEKSVARLSQEDKLEQIAFELGRSHCRYSAPPKYYEYVGVQFISAVKPIVKENWTQAVEESWQSLFLYLTEVMKRGYHEEERKNGVNKTSYGTQAPSMWAEVTGAVHNKV